MNDQKKFMLISFQIPTNEDLISKRLTQISRARNSFGAATSSAFANIDVDNIVQVVVGPNCVGFLFKDGNVARASYEFVRCEIESVLTTDDKPAQSGRSATTTISELSAAATLSTGSALNRSAKIRRVMMAARRPGTIGERAGVIVDRTRGLLPVSAIPEELIAQAQVVLQGKPRDVIVRELQRTNLNVNEAVNNLLSRDDEEGEDLDEGSDAYLPEELLSLLDAGLRGESQGGGNEDSVYPSEFDYLIARDFARRRPEKDKKSEKAKEVTSKEPVSKLVMGSSVQFWAVDAFVFPAGVTRFTKIASLSSELIAIGDNGSFYGWSWTNDGFGSLTSHPMCIKLLSEALSEEKFVDIETCAHRACVATSMNRVASFMDFGTCGMKVSEFLCLPLRSLPDGEKYASMYVCPMYSLIKTQSKAFYWWGIYPFNERRKQWDRFRSKSRLQSTSNTSDIVEGCKVRTKSHPIYCCGSLALNFCAGAPMVGTLMESAWTLTEVCRFQVRSPSAYDDELIAETNTNLLSSAAHMNENGKRSLSEETPISETAWAMNEIVFIREECSKDTGIVKIVDGAYCGVVFHSSESSDDSHLDLKQIRLMHKEDLVAVSTSNKSCSPHSFQRSLTKLPLPSSLLSRKIHAVAVDNVGIRLLVEKRGRFHLLLMNVLGKIVTDHLLPLNGSVFIGGPNAPCLENYGDESLLVIRDKNGSPIPLRKDAMGGILEVDHLALPPIHKFSVGVRPLEKNSLVATPSSVSELDSRSAVLFAVFARSSFPLQCSFPSLMDMILYCDVKGVENILDAMTIDCSVAQIEVSSRSDGNRNILHTAIMLASSSTNRDNADVGNCLTSMYQKIAPENSRDTEMKSSSETQKDDKTWLNMLKGYMSSTRESSELNLIVPCSQTNLEGIESVPTLGIVPNPIHDTKQRQLNALEIIRCICIHPVIAPYLQDLLLSKDVNGHTPFMCAVNIRAYTAARIIWGAIKLLPKEIPGSNSPSQRRSSSSCDDGICRAAIFPSGSRVDDSPLFVLCANDTCSFTWTGDEHIDQDIFECKTCGLIDSLCCCTECAFTCHRNHDCQLKRTSPTAYCDCWERCSCKALVKGNTAERERLFNILIKETDLILELNSRGEHLLLFLAQTVGRQLVEQEGLTQRRSTKTKSLTLEQTREHDLEPPKFARTAFSKLLSDWPSVKSLFIIGINDSKGDAKISEELFYLLHQSGSSQLDKFTFFLVSKCTEANVDTLMNTLIIESNRVNGRDADIDALIGRFIRSVIRIFMLITLIYPNLTGSCCGTASTSSDRESYSRRSESVNSSFNQSRAHSPPRFGRISTTTRESKASRDRREHRVNVFTVIHKCKRIFFTLISYSIAELCNAADALMAPVRLGAVVPSVVIQAANNASDSLEVIERFLCSEFDSSLKDTKKYEEGIVVTKAKRHHRDIRHTRQRPNDQTPRPNLAGGGGGGSTVTHTITSDLSSDSNDDDYFDELRTANFEDDELRSVSGDEGESIYSASTPSEVDIGAASNDEDIFVDNFDIDERAATAEFNPSTNRSNDGADRTYERGDDESYDAGDDALYERNDDHDESNINEPVEMDGEEDEDHEDEDDDGSESSYSDGNRDNDDHAMEQVNQTEGGIAEHSDEPQHRISRFDSVGISSNTEATIQQSGTREIDSLTGNADVSSLETSAPTEATRAHTERLAIDRPEFSVIDDAGGTSNSARSSGVTSGRNNSAPLSWAIRSLSSAARSPDRRRSIQRREGDETSDDNETYVVDVQFNSRSNESSIPGSTNVDEDNFCSISKTNMQLSTAFSIIARYVIDLLLVLNDFPVHMYKSSYRYMNNVLDVNETTIAAIRKLVDDRFSPTWNWMSFLLDRMEAKFRFAKAFVSSSARLAVNRRGTKLFPRKLFDNSTKKRDSARSDVGDQRNQPTLGEYGFGRTGLATPVPDSVSKKEDKNSSSMVGRSRSDFMRYIFSLMRAHASENADSVPVIELGVLKSVSHIADAYLLYIDALEKISMRNSDKPVNEGLASLIKEIDMFEKDEDNNSNRTDICDMKGAFFMRSNSLLYPGITNIPPHHAFEYKCSYSLALSENPHLLRPGVEKGELFGLPAHHRPVSEHERDAREHGITNATHQGFADPWSHFTRTCTSTNADSRDESGEPAPNQERPNVIVHAKNVVTPSPSACPRGFSPITLDIFRPKPPSRLQKFFSRWKHCLDVMAKFYYQQILTTCGGDVSGSLLLMEFGGFCLRELQFRKRMENFRSMQPRTRDLVFEVERDKQKLIAQAFNQLNEQYKRRSSMTISNGRNTDSTSADNNSHSPVTRILFSRISNTISPSILSIPPDNSSPLASYKVKVAFKDEPGEGSGVARSFYTALADALSTMLSLPSESSVASAFNASSSDISSPQSVSGFRLRDRGTMRDRSSLLFGRRRMLRSRPYLSVRSRPYYSVQQPHLNEPRDASDVGNQNQSSAIDGLAPLPQWDPEREALAERLLTKVHTIRPLYCNKITGMILDLTSHQIVALLTRDDMLRSHVEEAAGMLTAAGYGGGDLQASASNPVDLPSLDAEIPRAAPASGMRPSGSRVALDDLSPLFYRPYRSSFYAPIAGKNSPHRIRAFRNVGRLMGICLLQTELFPLHLCRHVLKYILGRPINWYDLAFYDHSLFESLRTLLYDEGLLQPQPISELGLAFAVNLPIEEGGGTLELKAGGSNIEVNVDNVIEYIYLFIEARLLGTHIKCLEAIKQGVYDVLPSGALNNITAEDFRLLLYGTYEISISRLQSYTSFTDESSSKPEVLQKFKNWFWSICKKMTIQEKQDLLFFWTGSKSLPASKEAFQPVPNIYVRPADDHHLPYANTCISRLYLPLYSKKKIFKSKLLLAIKTTYFGFV